MNVLSTILLGVIEGVTEFLPISSTGHLLIAEQWLGERSELFNVFIQAGATLAVVAVYWQRLVHMAVNWRDPVNYCYLFKLFLAFIITGTLGFMAKKLGFKLPATVVPIAWALVAGGFWILAAEYVAARQQDQTAITWPVAVAVGLAQSVAAVFPGTSRSAASIFAAMSAGTSNRATAADFAFLVGIPTMFAASGYELLAATKAGVAGENWRQLAIAFVVAAVTAFVSIKWLLRYIQTHRFTMFAIYRIVLGVLLFGLVAAGVLI